jgi:hypothetical protein
VRGSFFGLRVRAVRDASQGIVGQAAGILKTEHGISTKCKPLWVAAMAVEDDKGLGAGLRNANAEARDLAVPNLVAISGRPQIADGEISECGRFCHGQISLPDKSTRLQPDFWAESLGSKKGRFLGSQNCDSKVPLGSTWVAKKRSCNGTKRDQHFWGSITNDMKMHNISR